MIIRLSYLLGTALILVSSAWAQDLGTLAATLHVSHSDLRDLSKSPEWEKLLHIKRNILGFKRTQVRDPRFLIVKNGDRDKYQELVGTLGALLNPDLGPGEEHALCRFPARKLWLQKKLHISDNLFPKPNCRLLEMYKSRMKTQSVSFIFSSYFADSPSSTFGHTLFRVSRDLKAHQQKNELLDWGIGYAGEVATANPLVYIFNGLTGGFKGSFSSVPYYMKIREYNDYEARDIWSYELNLSPEEIEMLILHLWEVGDHYYDYYFLTQNCGYHLLTVLEAASPRLSLVDRVPFWVIPADALKAVVDVPGFVKEVSFRPSILFQLEQKYSHLSFAQKERFKALKAQLNTDVPLTENDPQIVDALISYFDFKNAKKIAGDEESVLKKRNEILLHRSGLPVLPMREIQTPDEKQRPDKSHPSARLTLQSGRNSQVVNQLEMRFALHDGLDPQNGYPLFSTVEMFRFNARQEGRSLALNEFDFVGIESIAPINDLRKELSWSARFGYRWLNDEICQACSVAFGQFGYGYSFEFIPKTFVGFGFLRGSLLAGSSLDRGVGFQMMPDLGLLWNLKPLAFRLSLGSEWTFLKDTLYRQRMDFEARYHFKNRSFFQAKAIRKGSQDEGLLGWGFFF